MARVAGVSTVTVSRVINGMPLVRPETQMRVRKIIQELGYRPNAAARVMRTTVTETIGFVISNLTNRFTATIAQAAQQTLTSAGYLMVVASSNHDAKGEAELLSLLQQHRVDGIIAQLMDEENQRVHDIIKQSSIPFVIIDRDLPFPVDAIKCDHYDAMSAAIKYLISLGHQRIALVGPRRIVRPGRERVRAFADTMRAAGLELKPEWIRCDHQIYSYARQETLSLLTMSERPTALVSGCIEVLPGVLSAIQSVGLRVPQDLSLISADTDGPALLEFPPLTGIERDAAQMGVAAAEMMLGRLRHQHPPGREVNFPSRVVLQSSCDRPRTV